MASKEKPKSHTVGRKFEIGLQEEYENKSKLKLRARSPGMLLKRNPR